MRSAAAALAVFLWIGPALAQKPESDKAVFEAVCGKCHAPTIASELRSEPEWKETIDAMVRLGAEATDEQFAAVLRYLVRTQSKVNVNTATAAEIAPVLDITRAASEAIVKRRAETGGFRRIEDLKGIPGVDPSKIDSRKQRIVFR